MHRDVALSYVLGAVVGAVVFLVLAQPPVAVAWEFPLLQAVGIDLAVDATVTPTGAAVMGALHAVIGVALTRAAYQPMVYPIAPFPVPLVDVEENDSEVDE